MSTMSSISGWFRSPSRVALLLGLSTLFVAGAKADTSATVHTGSDDALAPQQSSKGFGDLLIWKDDTRIYFSESGKPAEELHLKDTAEADFLRQLLEQEGATATMPRLLSTRAILAGAGGSGLHWDSQRPDSAKPAPPARDSKNRGPATAPTAEGTGTPQTLGKADDK
jgi:hypothetical protein